MLLSAVTCLRMRSRAAMRASGDAVRSAAKSAAMKPVAA